VSLFDQELDRRLAASREQGLGRSLRQVDSPQGTRIRVNGRELLSFSSNDYLGLANHPALKEAALRAVTQYGAGCGASRLICGSLAPHHELEEALAAFKGTEAALTFSTGYATALGTLPTLVGKGDVVVIDKLVHACIVDAARLSGAMLRVFAHNDLSDLTDILKWADRIRSSKLEVRSPKSDLRPPTSAIRDPGGGPRVLIVTESVFSMDGDLALLREIVELKDRYGAWLMVDEAHATGIFGKSRRGLLEEFGLTDQVEVQMGTLGKALGASGGYIAGSRLLIDYLVNRARSFIFSTAPVPAATAAARAAVDLVQSDEGRRRCEQLRARVAECRAGLTPDLWPLRQDAGPAESSPILPLIIGDEAEAVRVAAALMDQGVFIPAVRYPAVAHGSARLRLTLSAEHTTGDLTLLHQALASVVPHSAFRVLQ
jgi:7-keto-8-aminopelargonate synthetase-like enzyme